MDEADGYQGSCFVQEQVTLAPSESVVGRYEVLPETTDHYPDHTAPTSGGTYAVRGELTYRDAPPAPASTIAYEARLTLEFR